LQVDPQVGAVAAELAKLDRHLGRHRRLLVQDVIERLPGNAEQPRDFGLRLAQRRKHVLPQRFSGMERLEGWMSLCAILLHQW
jgi:hypothetical protein